MSSPAGLYQTEPSFLSHWIPNGTRAGVVLCSGSLVGSESIRSGRSSVPLEVSDSFCSHFAPLPVSSCSSSSSSVDECPPVTSGTSPGLSGQVLSGEMHGIEEILKSTQDLPMTLKLEQLKLWQQHMQEQLRAHQLEQLLRLQEEQQRLLGLVQDDTELLKFDEDEGPRVEVSLHSHTSHHGPLHTLSKPSVPLAQCTSHTLDREEEEKQEIIFGNGKLNHNHIGKQSTLRPEDDDSDSEDDNIDVSAQSITEDLHREKSDIELQERPIRQSLIGRTFEELLEEQLRLEKQRLGEGKQGPTEEVKVKRPFLRRGQGLSRFTKGKVTSPQSINTCRADIKPNQASDPRTIRGPSSTSSRRTANRASQRRLVQRKTAVLSKENSQSMTSPPSAKGRTVTSVLGMHQGQNVTSAPVQSLLLNHERPTSSCRAKAGQVTVVPKEGIRGSSAAFSEERAVCVESATEEAVGTAGRAMRLAERSFEVWLAERGERWEHERLHEFAELGEFELLEQAADELSFSSNSSFVRSLLQRDCRRLSSTPIKLPHQPTILEGHRSEETSDEPHIGTSHKNSMATESVVRLSEKGGVCARQYGEMSESTMNEENEDDCEGGEEELDMSVLSSSGFGHQEAVSVLPISHPFHVENPPYDKRTYQDTDSTPQLADVSSSDHGDLTLVPAGGCVEFDDDDTWTETEEVTQSPFVMDHVPEVALKRKVATSKGVGPSGHPQSKTEAPPTSQLVAKLFPALKPKLSPPKAQPQKSPQNEQGTVTVQSQLLRERLVELETEIERFKRENASLVKLRQQNQDAQESLRKDRADFEKKKAEEERQWEELKQEEGRKLQRERKLFEKHAATARARPDKHERDEIQSLRQQLSALQEDVKRREARWANAQQRLRQQLDSLGTENGALRDQVRMLEKLRVSAWKCTESESEKQRKMRDREADRSSHQDASTSPATRGPKSRSPARGVRYSLPQGGSNSKGSQRPGGPPTSAGKNSSQQKSSQLPASSPGTVTPEEKSKSPVHQKTGPEVASESVRLEQEDFVHSDGKIERVLPDGGRLIVFPNGTQKELSADGLTIKVTFFNGDVKQVMPDQRVIYYYAEAETTHTTYPDGMEVLQFPNSQTEKNFPDGRKEITFPDQTVKNLYPDGREESVLTDGTIIQLHPDGSKQIQFNTGQRELHTADFKRREYPDGTVKTVYADGRQETRYSTGRIRLKDPNGHVIMDTVKA